MRCISVGRNIAKRGIMRNNGDIVLEDRRNVAEADEDGGGRITVAMELRNHGDTGSRNNGVT